MKTNQLIKFTLTCLLVLCCFASFDSITKANILNAFPNTLEFSTFLGGSGVDTISNIELDSEGNMVIVGATNSPDLPTTANAYDPSYNGNGDAFIIKLSPDGSTLLYCSYLGGSGQEWSSGATGVLDNEGNIYIIGTTQSSNFPTTEGAFDRHYEPSSFGDMFISKLDFEGNLLASTFLGGTGDEEGIDIGYDGTNIYVTGWSRSYNFPGTEKANMYDSSLNGGYDVVVAKITSDLSDVMYGTYIGSSGLEVPSRGALFIDENGNVYIGGSTYASSFPTTAGSFDPTWNGTNTSYHGDGFILLLKNDFSDLVFSSFIGGSAGDRTTGINVDSQGYVYLTGLTQSTNFPDTFGTGYGGGDMDGFLTKINPDGSTIIFSKYIGGIGLDVSSSVKFGANGKIYLSSNSDTSNLFVSDDAYSDQISGNRDGYFMILSSDGSQTLYASYVGGSNDDSLDLRVVDSDGSFYFSGLTNSANFPITNGVYDSTYNGGDRDGVVLKFMIPNSPPTANAGGPYPGSEGAAVLLDGSTSADPDGDVLAYSWVVDSGLCSFDDSTSIYPNLTCTDNGSFTVTLTVNDGQETASADANVIVANIAPTASLLALNVIDEGSDINISMLGSDPSPDDTSAGLEYAFDCDDGSGYGPFSTDPNIACPTTDNGIRTIKGKIRDKDGGENEYQRTITIVNVAPTASLLALNVIDEGSDINISMLGSDPSPDDTSAGLEYAFDCDDGSGYGPFSTDPNIACPTTDNGIRTIKGKIRDKDGGENEYQRTITIVNVAPTVGPISTTIILLPVDTPFEASAGFTDPGTGDTHTAVWDWGDETTIAGSVIQGAGFGSVADTYAYATAGVYSITLTITDDDGDSATSTYQYIVVYDPDGGFVTGGGWIDSLAGAYLPDSTLSGKATFGFVSKYKKGTMVPTGNTEFQFHVADLNFKSTSYDWLVVTGDESARFKGTGTINGAGEYKFMIWAGDGDTDTFRIKIWEEDEFGVETVVYDNGFDQAIGGGSIVVHTGK